MGISTQEDKGGTPTSLSEINVTPLVDVMLVLLTIFMIASSVETIQAKQEKQKLLEQQKRTEDIERLLQRIKELERKSLVREEIITKKQRKLQVFQIDREKIKDLEERLMDRSQNVPIDLPKANSEPINLAEQKKIVISFTKTYDFYIGDTKVVSCREFNPDPKQNIITEQAYRLCLTEIQRKVVANEKLQQEGECYLRADKNLDYGKVLALMATIRKAGVTKFGLIAEQEENIAEK